MTWNRHARAAASGALAVLLASATLAAWQSAPANSTGIRGRVKNAADDTPIARARVLAATEGASDPHVAITGADGTYTFDDLPPATYTVSVTRTGFAPQTYGQDRQNANRPVTVSAGQHATVDVALVPGRTIAGRILDEDGTPFAGATVEALASGYEGGKDTLVSVATTETNDRGEFRLYGLPAGQYYISAADPAFTSVTTPKGVLRYSPTYYPGVAAADQARPITVGDAGEPPSVEFRLKIVPPARISGRLISDDGRRLINGAIVLSAIEGDGIPVVPPDAPALSPDGGFVFPHVPPGRYQIRARGQTAAGHAARFAVFAVDVLGIDLDGILMTLHPGAIIDGAIAVESRHGTKPPALSSLRVRAPFTDGNGFGDALTGTAQPDGSFALRGVMKGPHQLVVEGLQPPWTVKSINYRGSDVTDRAFDVDEKQQFHGVRITITDVSSVVSGRVQNARSRPVADAGVLIFPSVPLLWTRTSRRMRIVYTDADGRFTLSGLPAGQYVAVASLWVSEADLGRRERLRELQPTGVPFTLDTDDATAMVSLRIASAPTRPGGSGSR